MNSRSLTFEWATFVKRLILCFFLLNFAIVVIPSLSVFLGKTCNTNLALGASISVGLRFSFLIGDKVES